MMIRRIELAGAEGVSCVPWNTGEQIQRTCESNERRELERAAGDPVT